MSQPDGEVRFGLCVCRKQEVERGWIRNRNLRELFEGSAEAEIPDALVESAGPGGLVVSVGYKFGLVPVGYTEYTDCTTTLSLPEWSIPALNFQPDDIQSLDPKDFSATVVAGLADADTQWQSMMERLCPKPLLWQYIHGEEAPLPPRVLFLTLST